ncbi:MAG: hypothetical protein VXZ84_11725, partial [Planctomycetota bacterium]|nr:hypothetical protein [Planctomycetota bacterium]
CPLNEENYFIQKLNPGFIVIPKANYDFAQLLKFREERRRIIVMDTEGNPQEDNYKVRILLNPDLYLFWNEPYMRQYKDDMDVAGISYAVLGCPRTDFLSKNFRGLLPPRHELLARYDLDPKRRTVTLATASQESHFGAARWKLKKGRRRRSLKYGADYSLIVENSLKLKDLNEAIIRSFVDREGWNLVVKPHPNESVIHWQEFIQSLNSPNIALMTREPISTLLAMSDLHVCNNYCTTSAEAVMFGLPTVEVHTDLTVKTYGDEHKCVPHFIVRSAHELQDLLDSDEESGKTSLNDVQTEYLRGHYGELDGQRCQKYAEYLAQYIQDCRSGGEPVRGLTVSNRALALILKFWRLLNTRKRKAAQIASMRTNHPEAAPEDAVIEINGVKTSKEYGLIDNRMRIGDEAAWNIKFDEIGVGVARNSVRADGLD